MARSEFVTRRLEEEAPHFAEMLVSADPTTWNDVNQIYSKMSQDVLEQEAEHDESLFGYEGFMARFEIYRREHSV